jgi:hypothetical protein
VSSNIPCCGMAGDRGLRFPELTGASLQHLNVQVRQLQRALAHAPFCAGAGAQALARQRAGSVGGGLTAESSSLAATGRCLLGRRAACSFACLRCWELLPHHWPQHPAGNTQHPAGTTHPCCCAIPALVMSASKAAVPLHPSCAHQGTPLGASTPFPSMQPRPTRPTSVCTGARACRAAPTATPPAARARCRSATTAASTSAAWSTLWTRPPSPSSSSPSSSSSSNSELDPWQQVPWCPTGRPAGLVLARSQPLRGGWRRRRAMGTVGGMRRLAPPPQHQRDVA